MTNRRFSIDEANALVPQLETLLKTLFEKRAAHDRLHDHLFMGELIQEAVKDKSKETSEEVLGDSGAQEVDGRLETFEAEMKAIRSLGCLLRNLERGVVEFPAEHRGQSVFFCWKKGEKSVAFYRPAQSPVHERFPL